MRHLATGLLIIFFSSVITGCAQPTGSISGGGSGGNNRDQYHFLMLRPRRILYELNNTNVDKTFIRDEDLTVFVADDKGYRQLTIPEYVDLKLEVILYPTTLQDIKPVDNGYFNFDTLPGRHIIRGTYGNKTDEYSVEVRGSLVNPGPGSDFIGMHWLEDD